MNRPPRHSPWRLAGVALAFALAAACGKKGPPLPPLHLVPARIDDLVVRRLGDDIYLQCSAPSRNSNGSTPADLREVVVFALTGTPADALGRPLDEQGFRRAAAVVARVGIAPPAPDGETASGQDAGPSPRGPAQGERVTATERLAPDQRVPWTPPGDAREQAAATTPEPAWFPRTPLAPPLVSPPAAPLARHYAVAGESRSGRPGPLSARVAVRLDAPPPAPSAPEVTYEADGFALTWRAPEGVRRAPAGTGSAAEGEPLIPSRVVFAVPVPHTYNVYELTSREPSAAAPVPLNPAPLVAARFESSDVRFGVERCFVVRTVEAAGPATVESPASPPTCVTARDTFPPPAPGNLAAVGGEGAINLIWEASQAPDLAGYLVLRGEPGGALQAITSAPIRETTFRDEGVTPGTRYAYAVVAVDGTDPPNVSAPSNRVEETAR